jgi:excisionase family DNA binding protein
MNTNFDAYLDAFSRQLHRIEERLNKIESFRNDDQDDFMTVSEVADFLSLAKQTIYQLVSRKEIPSFKRFGRRYFSRKEVESWLVGSRRISEEEADQMVDDQISRTKKS